MISVMLGHPHQGRNLPIIGGQPQGIDIGGRTDDRSITIDASP